MFYQSLSYEQKSKKTSLCIGLDLISKENKKEKVFDLIEQTKDHCICFKLNPAFYLGQEGLVKEISDYFREKNILWIYDGKIGDVPHTNTKYGEYILDYLGASALTVSPFLGLDSLKPLRRKNKGIFLLASTTNSNSQRIQQLTREEIFSWCIQDRALSLVVAGNTNDASSYREKLPFNWFLTPGIGVQGGSIGKPVDNVLYSVSRSIINSKYP